MDTEKVFNFEELKGVLEKSEGFMIGLTTINGGDLRHFLLTEKFPLVDMLPSLQKIKEISVNRLEDPSAKNS
jgi:hypothetical protein